MSALTGDIAIRVSNVSKMFKMYQKPADMFWEIITSKPRYQPFWALRDICFEIKRGQVVGLIGRNGAGKSTLLKLITGTLDKTSGEIEVNGRISSILELGIGFNPEYTGRDNIYLGGLMVGLTRAEIDRKVDWIIEFSELEDVIDQTFKTYSTGMQARLTFSTAVCIDPDILIVDEVLSVGDAKFQRKSFNKIEEFRQAGRTILLVSHDLNTISTFCNHAVFLEAGQIVDQGEPQKVTKIYYQMLFCEDERSVEPGDAKDAGEAHPDIREDQNWDSGNEVLRQAALRRLKLSNPFDHRNPRQIRMGNKKAEILDIGILDEDNKRITRLQPGSKYTFLTRAVFYENVDDVVVGFLIRDIRGVDMYGTSTLEQKVSISRQVKGNIIEATLQATMWLTNGIYFLTVALGDPDAAKDVQYDLAYDAFQFEVALKPGIFTTSVVDLNSQIACTMLTRAIVDHEKDAHESTETME